MDTNTNDAPKNNNSDRSMPSIFPECNELKQAYDKCFTNFFQQFISSESQPNSLRNPCERLHKIYKECLDRNLAKYKPYDVDLEELRSEVLTSLSEQTPKSEK